MKCSIGTTNVRCDERYEREILMVRLEAADLVDDAAVVPPLKFSEAGNNESGVRNSINIRDVQGIRGGVEYGLY